MRHWCRHLSAFGATLTALTFLSERGNKNVKQSSITQRKVCFFGRDGDQIGQKDEGKISQAALIVKITGWPLFCATQGTHLYPTKKGSGHGNPFCRERQISILNYYTNQEVPSKSEPILASSLANVKFSNIFVYPLWGLFNQSFQNIEPNGNIANWQFCNFYANSYKPVKLYLVRPSPFYF